MQVILWLCVCVPRGVCLSLCVCVCVCIGVYACPNFSLAQVLELDQLHPLTLLTQQRNTAPGRFLGLRSYLPRHLLMLQLQLRAPGSAYHCQCNKWRVGLMHTPVQQTQSPHVSPFLSLPFCLSVCLAIYLSLPVCDSFMHASLPQFVRLCDSSLLSLCLSLSLGACTWHQVSWDEVRLAHAGHVFV